jgi:hypothetical protein
VRGVLVFAAHPAVAPGGRIQLTVEAKHSDELLRRLLADPGVHIAAIQ